MENLIASERRQGERRRAQWEAEAMIRTFKTLDRRDADRRRERESHLVLAQLAADRSAQLIDHAKPEHWLPRFFHRLKTGLTDSRN